MCFFFFFNDTATTEIYTLSLHDALPISLSSLQLTVGPAWEQNAGSNDNTAAKADFPPPFYFLWRSVGARSGSAPQKIKRRSEEHTSELQSRSDLVCRLLLEKKKRWTSIH